MWLVVFVPEMQLVGCVPCVVFGCDLLASHSGFGI